MSTIEERVAAGAAWLDEQRPGWSEHIDLGELDMADGCLCVLGQVWNEFDEDQYTSGFDHAANGLGAPALAGGFTATYGFGRSSAERRAEFAALGTAWKQLIAARRAA